jgi:ABC-2 type transport system ATP-binding protein
MEWAIDISELTVRYPVRGQWVTALEGLTLRVGRGEALGFIGPNGAGKTTAMHVLLGLVEAQAGHARIFGRDARRPSARARIGYLPEHPDTYRFLTGRELLTLTGRLFRIRRDVLRARVGATLRQVDIEAAADRKIGTYSKGMLQRICLAQALINDPDLVILDEPTGGLDPFGRLEVRKLIARLRDEGKTVFFSSHELSEVELVCDRIAMLARGRLVAEGRIADMVATGESLERFFMRTVSEVDRP